VRPSAPFSLRCVHAFQFSNGFEQLVVNGGLVACQLIDDFEEETGVANAESLFAFYKPAITHVLDGDLLERKALKRAFWLEWVIQFGANALEFLPFGRARRILRAPRRMLVLHHPIICRFFSAVQNITERCIRSILL
jgi:hypothetical protein